MSIRRRSAMLTLTVGLAVSAGGCGTSPPQSAACDLVRSTDVAALTGSPPTRMSEVTSDSGPSGIRGCAFASGDLGIEVWYLRDGGRSFFDSQTRGDPNDPTLTRTELHSFGVPAIELPYPAEDTVMTLKHGHYVDVDLTASLAATGATRDVTRRLAAAITRSVP
jgi:hypothetical protein